MEKHTLKILGARLRKEIVPLEDLPFPMREALRKLADKYEHSQTSSEAPANGQRPKYHGADSGGPSHPAPLSISKR